MKCYIVDIGIGRQVPVAANAVTGSKKSVKLDKSFVLLTETGKLNETTGMPMYAINLLKEAQLVQTVVSTPGLETINFRVVNGEIKNKEGDASLARFNQEGFKEKPIVVLAEIHAASNGALLGYMYATNNGYTYMRKTEDFLNDCEALIKRAHMNGAGKNGEMFKPIQNMKFIGVSSNSNKTGKAYVSSYTETNPIPVLVITQKKNSYSKPSAEEKIPKKPTSKEMLKSIYTDAQLIELKKAKKEGVDIRIISNPKLSPEQMHSIWVVEAAGKPARKYADPDYKKEYMDYMGMMLRCGVDIDPILNPLYSKEQATEILRGIQLGLDVNVYADPKLTGDEMYRRRRDLELGMWGKNLIFDGSGSGERRVIKQPLKKA